MHSRFDIRGMRTFTFSVISLFFLTFGFALSLWYPTAGVAIFGSFALAIVGIVGAVAGKSIMGAAADGNGLKGMANTLLTDAKPGEAPKPPPAPAPKPNP